MDERHGVLHNLSITQSMLRKKKREDLTFRNQQLVMKHYGKEPTEHQMSRRKWSWRGHTLRKWSW